MSTIFDMLYHEYCRARLAEMRKQLLIPVIGGTLLAPSEDDDPSGLDERGWPAKAPPTIG
ncbi:MULTISPECIES: hypothetical protein [unclassified Bradyrhizobium]|uniref:hypothetical protein n=1 Tax=unclassified Bradyrhizobium TaxID=2631580 RepID=UPI000426AFDC|nr:MULTISPECIES: hypothetical protein [unclassified Bradyrhizobium]QIG91032.1 hypothetical protein G6P99_22600 [Bradyrhizobium sp. 6(2017)]